MRVVCLALVCTWSIGCTYRHAVDQAHNASEAGDWRGSLAAWAEARDARPRSDDAVAGWKAARTAAIADGLASAEGAIASGEYEAALAHLDFVSSLDPDRPAVYVLRRDVRETLEAKIATAIGGGSAREAYGLAVRLRALFPRADAVDGLFEYLRGHFAAETERLTEARARGGRDAKQDQ